MNWLYWLYVQYYALVIERSYRKPPCLIGKSSFFSSTNGQFSTAKSEAKSHEIPFNHQYIPNIFMIIINGDFPHIPII